jgi:hypothetical protein
MLRDFTCFLLYIVKCPLPCRVNHKYHAVDASTVDVYKGAHAVIFMVDPTRKWTLDYVEKKTGEVPKHLDVFICVGMMDEEDKWVLTESGPP